LDAFPLAGRILLARLPGTAICSCQDARRVVGGGQRVIVAEVPAGVEAELSRLRVENGRLPQLLRMTPEQAAAPGPGRAAFFEAPPGLVDDRSPPM
jgi:hypothetical protein